MERTILVGDHLLVNKFAFAPRLPALARLLPYRDVNRGDIIVFKKPGDDVNPGNVLVKRAVAKGGDTVEVRDKRLYVNGRALRRARRSSTSTPRPTPTAPRSRHGPPARPVRPVPGAAGLVLRDGRQPRQLARQPLLGRRSRERTSSGGPCIIYWSYEAEPNSHIWRGPVAKIRQLAEVAIHFFSRTRWDRMFTLVR